MSVALKMTMILIDARHLCKITEPDIESVPHSVLLRFYPHWPIKDILVQHIGGSSGGGGHVGIALTPLNFYTSKTN